ncbi:DUF4236 domain-containing protein [Planctomicrobium sp. SH527]|uniref:DUF4236 domain-containing protein n=1 Tax=Planctomicrobium sp. SH527 TaxID=3448123 RepID=UPI003F5B9D75
MGFYFRKSFRAGPVRFNFSKSGIGVSTGIPGLRIGTGPRGNYVHVGRNGFYYRSALPSVFAAQRSLTAGSLPNTSAGSSHSPVVDSSASLIPIPWMVDSSSQKLIDEINKKRSRTSLAPLVTVLSIVLVGGMIWISMPMPLVILLGIILLTGVITAHYHDAIHQYAVVMYDLEEEYSCAFQDLFAAVEEIGSSSRIWQVHHQGSGINHEYHVRSTTLLNRSVSRVVVGDPPYLKTNVSIPGIRLQGATLYFLPDLLLLYRSDGIGAIQYEDLKVKCSQLQFLESGILPADAKVVGQTWRHTRKDGGPDLRYKDNPQIPICLYDEVQLTSSNGLQEVLQVSQSGAGSRLSGAVSAMVDAIRSALAAEEDRLKRLKLEVEVPALPARSQAQPPVDASDASSSRRIDSPELLFDFLCCVMAVDGKISANERAQIHRLMSQADRGWSRKSADERYLYFAERVRLRGFTNVVENSTTQLRKSAANGSRQTLLALLSSIQHEDFNVDSRGVQLLNQLQEQLGESTRR